MSCICIDDLRPASFRGVGFYVESDKGTYGRRNVKHEYPMRDTPYLEDMGQKATTFSVSGYLVGDDWVAQKDALVAASTMRGPALLQLPTEAPVMVVCDTLTVSRTKDACGFYALTFEFTVAKNFGVPSAVGVIESLIGSIFNAAVAPFTAMFDRSFVGGNVLQWVTENHIGRIVQLTSDIISMVESSGSSDDRVSSNVVQAAISVYQNASSYAQSSGVPALASQPIPALTIGRLATARGYEAVGAASGITVANASSAIVPMIAYMVNGIGKSMAPDAAISALTALSVWSVAEISLDEAKAKLASATPVPTAPMLGPSDRANAVNGVLFCGVVRSFALMKLAQAISVKEFRTRQEAIQARANVVELFNSQIEGFDEDEIVSILLSVRDNAVNSVTQKMATLVPVINVSAGASKPSLYWADRLYSDANRAEELSDRNNIASPAFMPRDFEALAR